MATKKINGRQFQVTPGLAFQMIHLQARLFKLAGPAMDQLALALRARAAGDEAAMQSIGLRAVGTLMASSDPLELATLVKDLCETAQISRKSGDWSDLDFDGDMTGHQKDLPTLLLFIIQVQFGDFFSGVPVLGTPPATDAD